jgi:predicted nucleotidyltransferase
MKTMARFCNDNFIYNLNIVSIDIISSIIKMLTGTQNRIIEYLYRNKEMKISIRGLSQKLGKSYTLVYNNLLGLEKKGIIKKYDLPPAKIVEFSDAASLTTVFQIELNIKNEFFSKYPWAELLVRDVMSAASDPFFVIAVFGSYAKGTAGKKSDLDILLIAKDRARIEEIERLISKAYTPMKKGIVSVLGTEFMEMVANSEKINVGNEAKKHHVLLYGAEQFHQMLAKANAE